MPLRIQGTLNIQAYCIQRLERVAYHRVHSLYKGHLPIMDTSMWSHWSVITVYVGQWMTLTTSTNIELQACTLKSAHGFTRCD